MHYHIILTERCNLKCKYCYEKSMHEFENGLEKKWDYDMKAPYDSKVSVSSLKKFLKKGDTLIFYGGEPLVMLDKLKEIIDGLKNSGIRYCMQTNGLLLDKLEKKYLMKIDKMLISIDGNEQRTDFNKGKGNYKKVIENLKKIRQEGYKGEIVARMCISEFPDLYEQVLHLTELIKIGIFDSVHWQLDAGFYKNDYEREKFSKFVENYDNSVSRLIDWWINEMKKGKVWKLYPFLGIFECLYYNKISKLQCGSGYTNFTINTNGNLSACPIMNSVKNFYCGDLKSKKLKEISCQGKCLKCDYYKTCGGRCLYWNYSELWPEQGNELICKTIKYLIDEIHKKIPEIRELIEKKTINEKDFEFEKYFGPEIIP